MTSHLRRIAATAAFIAALTLGSIPASAETHYRPHITVGVHGGVAVSQMSFSPSIPQKWPVGAIVGVQARYAEEKLFGIIAELNLVQRGWKETFKNDPSLQYSRTLNYISLPIMTHINFGSDRVRGFVNLGPEFSYMAGQTISSNFDYVNPGDLIPKTRRYHQMSMDVKNRFDYGITACLGCEMWVRPRNSVYIEARFYYGLGNIFPASKSDEFSASRCMNICATVGYNFRLK